ncbi:MAG: hypothetical protein ACYCVG_01395 [Leptospirillum sp.]
MESKKTERFSWIDDPSIVIRHLGRERMKKASGIILGLNLFFLIHPPSTWARAESPECNNASHSRAYKVQIDGILYGTPWHMLISTKFGIKTPFDSVSVFSTETSTASPNMPFKIGPHWSGVRGWVQVRKDGLHYSIRTKKDFYAPQPDRFNGNLACRRDSDKCTVRFSTDLP